MVGVYIGGPSDGREVVHIPGGVSEVCVRSPANAKTSDHYIRASQNLYWVGKCTHEPLAEGPECEPFS